MAYNILGINPFHNGSACILSDGKIVYFLEEERLTKYKHDANPFKVILDTLNKFKINEVVIAGINREDAKLPYTNEDPFYALIRKYYPSIGIKCTIPFKSYSNYHHNCHNFLSFLNSGFKKALGVVIDSGGSFSLNNPTYIEVDTIFDCDYSLDNTFKLLQKNYLTSENNPLHLNTAAVYNNITTSLGFKINEEGKVMGLSSYGSPNPNIPPLFNNYDPATNSVSILKDGYRKNIPHPLLASRKTNWHKNPNIDCSLEKDIAYKLQTEAQQIVGDIIEEQINKTNHTNVVCSGGYFLNCVSNYYLAKRFPHLNFYFEPVSHDGGTAIGAAYWRWKELNPNFQPKKLNSIYFGPQYTKEQLLEGIKKYVSN